MRLLPSLLVVAACASGPAPLPAYYRDPVRSPAPECPPSRFLVEAASSPDGRADAEARARAAVVRRISSAIEVETERVAEIARVDDRDVAARSLKQVIRERADFRHAELIQAAGAPEERDGVTWALACLDRERALDTLRREMETPLARFESAAVRAREALARKDGPGFTQAFHESVALEPELLPRFAGLRAIAAAPPEEERAFAASIRELHQAAGRRRAEAQIHLQVRADGLPPDLRDAVTEAFRAAIAGLGLRTVVARDGACPDGVHRVQVEVTPACRWGSLGHWCRPRFTLSGEACDTHRVVFEAGLDDLAQGVDPREVERALRKALLRIDHEKLEKKMRELFASELPLGG